jgi:hypothetical protein
VAETKALKAAAKHEAERRQIELEQKTWSELSSSEDKWSWLVNKVVPYFFRFFIVLMVIYISLAFINRMRSTEKY